MFWKGTKEILSEDEDSTNNSNNNNNNRNVVMRGSFQQYIRKMMNNNNNEMLLNKKWCRGKIEKERESYFLVEFVELTETPQYDPLRSLSFDLDMKKLFKSTELLVRTQIK
jgi:hypothetical protein